MSSSARGGRGRFDAMATRVDTFVSSPLWFAASMAMVLVWAAAGPMSHYSSTWQLVINTSTTILTFLIVGLAANSARRSTAALHAKLDAIAAGVEDLLLDHHDEQRAADAKQLRDSVGLEEHS